MNVIQFPTPRRMASSVQPHPGCPTWCRREDHDDSPGYHYGDFQGHQERDEGDNAVFAFGGRVITLVDGHAPHVELLVWAAEEDIVTTSENHPITPAEARQVAAALLRLADEAEGAGS